MIHRGLCLCGNRVCEFRSFCLDAVSARAVRRDTRGSVACRNPDRAGAGDGAGHRSRMAQPLSSSCIDAAGDGDESAWRSNPCDRRAGTRPDLRHLLRCGQWYPHHSSRHAAARVVWAARFWPARWACYRFRRARPVPSRRSLLACLPNILVQERYGSRRWPRLLPSSRFSSYGRDKRRDGRGAPGKGAAWSLRMEGYGGPAQPSPTIAQCLRGGIGWLEV